nr:NudC domain containing protein 3 [Hymenolepis microstoma]
MRRTDFFYEFQPGGKLGFPKGVALKIILKAFDKYDTFFKDYQEKSLSVKATEQHSGGEEKSATKPKAEISSTSETKRKSGKTVDSKGKFFFFLISHKDAEVSDQSKPNLSKPKSDLLPGENSTESEKRVVRASPGTLFKRETNGERLYEAEPDCYNGARRANFSWSQKHREIDIQVKIPEHIKSAKQLTVKIEKKHITISENGVQGYIINSNLSMDIKTETAQWSFEADEHLLTISLDKVREFWWDSAFEDEEKINVQEIDCSQPIHELDEEAQGKIAQLLFDQEQKRKGLATSEEQRIQNILKQAWNKDDSPFKGQPFDPNSIKIENSG